MNNKINFKIILAAYALALSSVFVPAAHAQEFPPLAKLAQQYLMRMNAEEGRTVSQANVVNPEQFEKAAVTDSIETVNRTIEEIRLEKQKATGEIQDSVKKDIDAAIINIRKTTEKPAYELQRAIDQERTALFENLTSTVDGVMPGESEKIAALQLALSESLDTIKANLEKESGLAVSFQNSRQDVSRILSRLQRVLAEKNQIIDSRSGGLAFVDTDNDGLSDYDETYIFKTDPKSAKTKGDGRTDGEKVRDGVNPLSDTEEKISYQDPREDRDAYVFSSYKVNKVQLIKEGERSDLAFEGVALPNSHITLFIYSTPIVATVKTDANGLWTYELEQELENGEHQIYVASADSSGRLIAKSNPILFTKSAEAATIGIAGSLEQSVGAQTFLKDNFILITLAVLIAVVILTMMFVGSHKDIRSAVVDLRNEVNGRS